jgi:hypothetical protein
MGRTAQAPRRKRISPVTRHIRALPCRGGSGVLFTRRNLHMPATTRREELKRLLALAAIAPLQAGPATRPSAGQVVPASGIGRRIRHLSYSDQGGRPDLGHLRDDGWIDVCERLECGTERVAVRRLRIPKAQRPSPNYSRFPTPNGWEFLEVGSWQWLGVGSRALGFDLLHIPVT